MKGAVAAGHPGTLQAAEEVLRAGGNAFDAALAGLLAACVVEPVLASLGGGGFLLASPRAGRAELVDFFVQTPRTRRPEVELEEVAADFGSTRQTFHIGRGSIATPGVVRGIFEAHRRLGRIPRREIFAPAIALAKEGTPVRAFDAHVLQVVAAIFRATPASAALYARPGDPAALVRAGDRLRLPELADTLDVLAVEGPDLFYRGEIAERITRDLASAGHLGRKDLREYAVAVRAPLAARFAGSALRLNPPPASGGILIAFALALLEGVAVGGDPDSGHLLALARAMDATGRARLEALARAPQGLSEDLLLEPGLLARYRAGVAGHAPAGRGTTHVSVLDGDGNAAALSVSNGESSAYVVPGTGILLNNMLGEADLNPAGLQRWPLDRRMTSMMAPTVVRRPDGGVVCLGSGGSNRIRSAVLQVLHHLLVRERDVESAVEAPRIHLEPAGPGGEPPDLLSVEGGLDPERIRDLLAAYPRHQLWTEPSMFFGGVHVVAASPARVAAAGDPRRGGVAAVLG